MSKRAFPCKEISLVRLKMFRVMDGGVACQIDDRTVFKRGGKGRCFHVLPGKQVAVGFLICLIKINCRQINAEY